MRKNLKFVIAFLTIVFLSGCGKDDKSVTSVIPPSFYTYGISDSTYSNAIPRNLEVTIHNDSTDSIRWAAPVFTTDPTGYKIYVTTVGEESTILVPGDITSILARVDTDTTCSLCTYTYRITSLFSIFDSTYNFYSEVESFPSAPFVLAR